MDLAAWCQWLEHTPLATSMKSFGKDGTAFVAEVNASPRTIYLIPESDVRPRIDRVLDDYWEEIFENELSCWVLSETKWPEPRSRETFREWFDVDLTDAVYDLVPDEPLTQTDVEMLDLDDVLNLCAWCGIEIDEGKGRFVAYKLAEREQFSRREGLTLHLAVNDDRTVSGILTAADSEKAKAGEDLILRVCSSWCEKGVRKAVPKALKRLAR